MVFGVDDLISIVVGLLVIIFRRPFAERTARFWNTNFNLGYGDRDIRWIKWLAVICGLVFIASGFRRFM
jgi:hypothetical protein